MEISNVEKVVSYYGTICDALPIGGFGIKVLHDALLELAVLKASGAPANSAVKAALQSEESQGTEANRDFSQCAEKLMRELSGRDIDLFELNDDIIDDIRQSWALIISEHCK